ncbi:MAG: hypothetical protein WC586_03255 [Methanoregula sp.]
MPIPQPAYSPLARLVLFMICLSLFGGIVAGVHYYAIDLPQQKAVPPDNGNKPFMKCPICEFNCKFKPDYFNCMSECDLIC